MTKEQRDKEIELIKANQSLQLHVKAKRIELILAEYQSLKNPDPVYFNGRGHSLTRAAWEEMSKEQREAFKAGTQ